MHRFIQGCMWLYKMILCSYVGFLGSNKVIISGSCELLCAQEHSGSCFYCPVKATERAHLAPEGELTYPRQRLNRHPVGKVLTILGSGTVTLNLYPQPWILKPKLY